jgi:hypothetical protein
MTFRQFAILIVRLQAVWFVVYALIEATYLPGYFARARVAYSLMNSALFFAILRMILHVAAAIALIAHAERVLSWLVKDSIPKAPADKEAQPTASAPPNLTAK